MRVFQLSYALSLVGLLFAHAVVLARPEPSPKELAPTSPWNVDYSEDSCRLGRIFGEGDDRMAVTMERYEPGDPFFMVVAGSSLGSRNGRTTDLAFGPDGAVREKEGENGELGDFGPAVLVSGMTLFPLPDLPSYYERDGDFGREAAAAKNDIFAQQISQQQEAQIKWLDVRPRGGKPVRLMLGAMDKPLAAMRQCTDELLTHWGLDLDQQRGMTRGPVPKTSPAHWITDTDYPSVAANYGQQAIVQVRLIVGSDGVPQSCHIQRATESEGFKELVCRLLMKRARFEPALGADGKPITTYWRTGVHFSMAN